ncbi:MAG: dialkylresorcinol condensing enzyme [Spongiibacteraceae bacterium]
MKKILVVSYTQTGQLGAIVKSLIAPVQGRSDIEVTHAIIRPRTAFPFPWPLWRFFNTFPETVYAEAGPIEPLDIDASAEFDLIILAYQVWFLSPSLPIQAFLQSEQAKTLLRNKSVITVIGCRNMWLMAQERTKQLLLDLGARLIDNVVLTDRTHVAATFISTPLWMLTGKRGPFLGGLVPAAGIPAEDIADVARFGRAIAAQLPARASDSTEPMFQGLGAVTVNPRMIASEKIALRSFRIWGGWLRALGDQQSLARKCLLFFYVIFLVTLILTVVPVSAIIKRLLMPFMRERVQLQRNYFAAPSGEDASAWRVQS